MISKITDNCENIVAGTKLKELKQYVKNIYQITKNEKHTIKNKTDKSWKTI